MPRPDKGKSLNDPFRLSSARQAAQSRSFCMPACRNRPSILPCACVAIKCGGTAPHLPKNDIITPVKMQHTLYQNPEQCQGRGPTFSAPSKEGRAGAQQNGALCSVLPGAARGKGRGAFSGQVPCTDIFGGASSRTRASRSPQRAATARLKTAARSGSAKCACS